MKKLIAGIHDFHEHVRPSYRERFSHLALGQTPDCLFVACSDSRVVPNLFASTDPGDLFVLRNLGNIVPPNFNNEESAGAAVEFATQALSVRDIVVCGHSSCGAMRAVLSGEMPEATPKLHGWLAHAQPSLERLRREPTLGQGLPPDDRLSQAHVLQQLEHLRTYPTLTERLKKRQVTLHAWWFDLAHAQVLAYDPERHNFVPLVELQARPV